MTGAIGIYQQDMQLLTSGVGGFTHLGTLYLRMGPTDKALAAYKGGLARDPHSAQVLVGLGNVARHLGHKRS